MLIVNKETLELYEAESLRSHPDYRHIIFDFTNSESVSEVLDGLGLSVLNMPNQPVFDSRYQAISVGNVIESDGVYSGSWVLSDIDLTKEQRAELIADKRYQVETGGVEVAGYQIPTDRHTQQVLTAMYVKAKEDSEYTKRFKTSFGFLTLTAEQIIQIADSVHAHVQAAFDREDELLTAIDNGDLITPQDW